MPIIKYNINSEKYLNVVYVLVIGPSLFVFSINGKIKAGKNVIEIKKYTIAMNT